MVPGPPVSESPGNSLEIQILGPQITFPDLPNQKLWDEAFKSSVTRPPVILITAQALELPREGVRLFLYTTGSH